MKSYRERYFENYIAVEDLKRPGKIKYEYAGDYVEPYVEDKELFTHKASMVLIELLGAFLFVRAAVRTDAFNSLRAAGGLGILSVIPWIPEIWFLIRFASMKQYVKEPDYEMISTGLNVSAVLHAILLAAMILCGSISLLKRGAFMENAQVIVSYLCTAVASSAIYRLNKRVFCHTLSTKEIRKVE